MHELRQDPLSDEWVIMSDDRGKRPEDFKTTRPTEPKMKFLPTCPFCPGNEELTPSELYALWDQRQNHWEMRVVPDRFPVLARDGATEPQVHGRHRRVKGVGRHDVIVETPDHSLSLHAFPEAQLAELLRIYKACFGIMTSDPNIAHVIIFRNHGALAGGSLEHPHSQIIGSPVIQSQIQSCLAEAMHHYTEFNECIWCASVAQELCDNRRIVAQSHHFVSLEPFASPSPFVTHIYPRRHMASFADINKEEIEDLSQLLKSVMTKLYIGLNDPDYNYSILSAPKGHDAVPYFHWHISIVPRLNPPTGLELGSGIRMNPLSPETAAEFLQRINAGNTVKEKETTSCST